jgi:hypothetical protein
MCGFYVHSGAIAGWVVEDPEYVHQRWATDLCEGFVRFQVLAYVAPLRCAPAYGSKVGSPCAAYPALIPQRASAPRQRTGLTCCRASGALSVGSPGEKSLFANWQFQIFQSAVSKKIPCCCIVTTLIPGIFRLRCRIRSNSAQDDRG